jgi:hypothetical protein
MVKKISFLLLASAILVTGYIAFKKLNYWERSARIFSMSNSDMRFEGRMKRGPGGTEGMGRFEMRESSDSTRPRSQSGLRGPEGRDRNMPDSLRQQFRQNEGNRTGRVQFEGGIRNGDSHRRGEFQGGSKINLRNVLWFLAVFASFTVISVYLDKGYSLISKRKKQ